MYRNDWIAFSVYSNLVLSKFCFQLVNNYNVGDIGMQSVLDATRKKRGPVPLALQKVEVAFHKRLGGALVYF